jgi:large subunit ribosomal protein L23
MGILDKIIKKGGKSEDSNSKKEDSKKEKTIVEKEAAENIKSKKKKLKIDKGRKEKTTLITSRAKKIVKEKIPVHYFDIIKKPHISEKAFNLADKNKYVFRVLDSSNKSEIKKAIESLYGVSVVSVNIIKVPRKRKRFRGIPGIKSGYKKAIATLAKGDSIKVIEE